MILKIEKSFYKSLDKIDYGKIADRIENILSEVENAENIRQIKNVTKMSGHKKFYRIKLADYRIGIELMNSKTIVLIIIAHRKDIYKNFP